MASQPHDPTPLADYRPVTGQRTRHDGWTAERQRTFLTAGCNRTALLRPA